MASTYESSQPVLPIGLRDSKLFCAINSFFVFQKWATLRFLLSVTRTSEGQSTLIKRSPPPGLSFVLVLPGRFGLLNIWSFFLELQSMSCHDFDIAVCRRHLNLRLQRETWQHHTQTFSLFVATENLHLAAGLASCLVLSLSACIQYAAYICKRKAHSSALPNESEVEIDLPFALVHLAVTITACFLSWIETYDKEARNGLFFNTHFCSGYIQALLRTEFISIAM